MGLVQEAEDESRLRKLIKDMLEKENKEITRKAIEMLKTDGYRDKSNDDKLTQTNEEINVKGRHPQRLWITEQTADLLRMQNLGVQHEFVHLSEHEEIISTYKDLLKMKDNALNENDRVIEDNLRQYEIWKEAKDKEIEALKKSNDWLRNHVEFCHDSAVEKSNSMAELKSKLARALYGLNEARHGFALIAEGEGSDEEVYMIMGKNYLEIVKETLADISATPVLADKFVFGGEVEDK